MRKAGASVAVETSHAPSVDRTTASPMDSPSPAPSPWAEAWVVYQPADRFWTFQAMEAAIFAALALALLIATIRLVRRVS